MRSFDVREGCADMVKRRFSILNITWAYLILSSLSSFVLAEQKIIQQEKLSFERCLNVITTSESKLAVSPEITFDSDRKRIAIFKLSDGTLTIECDGKESLVTVSTETD